MALFGRFRRKKRRSEDYVGRHRPGSWGEISLPPIEAASPPADLEVVETVTAAPAPAVVQEPAAVQAPPVFPPPAAPPAEPLPVPMPVPVESAAASQVEVPPAAAVAPVAVPQVDIAPRQRVRLAFADGTSMDIDDESGASEAFRKAAERLIDDPR